jgi:hypothetical protein
MSVLARVRAALSPDSPEQQVSSSDTSTARLFHCPQCDTVYVGETMDACTECSTPVEQIPTDADLGLI